MVKGTRPQGRMMVKGTRPQTVMTVKGMMNTTMKETITKISWPLLPRIT